MFDHAVKSQCNPDQQYTTYESTLPPSASLTQCRAVALEVLGTSVFFD